MPSCTIFFSLSTCFISSICCREKDPTSLICTTSIAPLGPVAAGESASTNTGSRVVFRTGIAFMQRSSSLVGKTKNGSRTSTGFFIL
ncbi:hypothetical protein PF008_g5309 [Phytophthora fragariae]|uniref:Secreted protein n=1 Tax=Phytophthora fragariae TaxID=53985 RepID=A0A6G0SAJ7_9STRA|nr:hypothetical protein PF008_g5309 [Phytophthora fragariae]